MSDGRRDMSGLGKELAYPILITPVLDRTITEEDREAMTRALVELQNGQTRFITARPATLIPDWVGCLEAFHGKLFGDMVQRVREMGITKAREFLRFRLAFIQEELDETVTAADAEGVVDGLIDLCVVAIGTLHAFGVDAREAWLRVHLSNMAKEPGANPKRPNQFGLPDAVKPKGWTAPTHDGNHGLLPEVLAAGPVGKMDFSTQDDT